MQKFTTAELSRCNGKNGAPAYFAYNKKVYDVTNSYQWQSGNHQVSHNAGEDLTKYLKDAPHGDDLINKFPVIGILEE